MSNTTQGSNQESKADEVKRLLAEIAVRQNRLAELVLGTPKEDYLTNNIPNPNWPIYGGPFKGD